MDTRAVTQSDCNDDKLIFAPEIASEAAPNSTWKILLVDDEPSVHQATKIALKFFSFEQKPLEFISAYSEVEAKQLIAVHPDTALILLDVIMETSESGLQVVRHIRDRLHNHAVRIVLRTGQPGQAPEESVVVAYDINDYKTKLELTQEKLFTTLVSGLRSYRDLLDLERSRAELETLNASLKNFNQQLEKQVQERTLDLAQKNLLLQQEVTDRQKAETALQIHVRALTHDLRNPLTGMVSVLSSFIPRQNPLDEIPPHATIPTSVMQRLLAGCDRLLQQISRLVEAAESETKGVQLVRESFSISELIHSLLYEWQGRLTAKRARVDLALEEALPLIDGDRTQLWRVIENLVGNALKHNPPGIQLTIRVARSEDGVWLQCAIADDGNGIEAASTDRVFELYRRGSRAKATQGLGLGLYICRRIVEAHGGTIHLISDTGKGCDFRFTLPVAGEPLAPSSTHL